MYSISFPPNPNEDQSVEVTKGGEDLDSDEEIPVIEVVETLRGQITQEGEQESPVLVESDDILGVDPSPDLETSVREFPQVVEPEQNLGAAIQENTDGNWQFNRHSPGERIRKGVDRDRWH